MASVAADWVPVWVARGCWASVETGNAGEGVKDGTAAASLGSKQGLQDSTCSCVNTESPGLLGRSRGDVSCSAHQLLPLKSAHVCKTERKAQKRTHVACYVRVAPQSLRTLAEKLLCASYMVLLHGAPYCELVQRV